MEENNEDFSEKSEATMWTNKRKCGQDSPLKGFCSQMLEHGGCSMAYGITE